MFGKKTFFYWKYLIFKLGKPCIKLFVMPMCTHKTIRIGNMMMIYDSLFFFTGVIVGTQFFLYCSYSLHMNYGWMYIGDIVLAKESGIPSIVH